MCTSPLSTPTGSYPQRSPQRWRNDIPVVPHVRASSRACRGIAPARRPILAAPLRSPPATFALHRITAGHEASVGGSNRTLRALLGTGSSPRSGRERLRTPHPRCMDLRCPHCPSTARRQLSTARALHPQCSSELSTSRSTAGENHTGVVPSVSWQGSRARPGRPAGVAPESAPKHGAEERPGARARRRLGEPPGGNRPANGPRTHNGAARRGRPVVREEWADRREGRPRARAARRRPRRSRARSTTDRPRAVPVRGRGGASS